VDTCAAHFLWKQVRKIISALVKVAKGEVAMEDVKRALQPTNVQEPVFDFGILPPEALILMDVTYEFEFQLYTHAIDKIYHELVTRLESISYRREFLNQLLAIACRR
jgi:tRNA U38,U39,U40 pseudouridine synthase TruA